MAIEVVKTKPQESEPFEALCVGSWFEWADDPDMIFLKISEDDVENCIGFADGYPVGDLYTARKDDTVTHCDYITISVGEK